MIKYSQFPKAIEIQTASYCNGGCLICPHSKVSKFLSRGVMEMNLFKDIIDQIPNPWSTRIIPYFNNEPFLDPLFIERLRYIKQRCPESEIEIATNVSKLDKKIQDKLLNIEIKELRLSVFGFTAGSHKKMMPGLSWEKVKNNLDLIAANKKLRANIGQLSIIMIEYPKIDKKDVELARSFCEENYIKFEFWGFLDRSGNVDEYLNKIYKDRICGCDQNRPLDRIHITYTGKVVSCSMDWQWEYVLGDLNTQSIQEVWDSTPYQEIRNRIYSKGRNAPEICKKCKISSSFQ